MILLPIAATIAALYLGFHYARTAERLAQDRFGLDRHRVQYATGAGVFIAAALTILLVVAIWMVPA